MVGRVLELAQPRLLEEPRQAVDERAIDGGLLALGHHAFPVPLTRAAIASSAKR